jgi:pyruvate/2-oxoglutarate dehydrogenase complex dihydrolipoamide acyltransferase (E2) component
VRDGELRVPIRIPQPGAAITEGTIIEWLVADGQQVDAGRPLYRLETDKIEIEVECPAAGWVRILGQPGETFAVGEEIGFIEP